MSSRLVAGFLVTPEFLYSWFEAQGKILFEHGYSGFGNLWLVEHGYYTRIFPADDPTSGDLMFILVSHWTSFDSTNKEEIENKLRTFKEDSPEALKVAEELGLPEYREFVHLSEPW
ncbi:hypothetical protein DXG01_009841 [Tephrocybe rancida]|nr:hypothetical protein DXG01_009841 [Tephrocybe rancida]